MDKGKYRCFTCGGEMSPQEICCVEKEMKGLSSEDLEFVYDQLPPPKGQRTAPFVHRGPEGFDILNLCWACWVEAGKKIA